MPSAWIVLAGAVVVGVLIGLVVVVSRRLLFGKSLRDAAANERKRAEDYRSAGLHVRTRFMRGKAASGNVGGAAFEHYIIPGGKNTPARIAVSIPVSAPGEFHLYPESTSTAFVKGVGLVREFQSGDSGLDGKYYFSGSSDEYLKAVFGVRANIDAARGLFAIGFEDLEKDAKNLVVSRIGDELLALADLSAAVGLLARLQLPPAAPGAVSHKLSEKQLLYALRGVALAVSAAGVIGADQARHLVDGWPAFIRGTVPIVLALWIATLVAAYFGLKGRSRAARGWVELLLFSPVLLWGFVGLLALANERFDRGEAVEHQSRLIRYHAVKGSKGRMTYHLYLEPWRGRAAEDLRALVDLHVSRDVYALAAPGQVWKVRVRPGWLGQAWIEELRPR